MTFIYHFDQSFFTRVISIHHLPTKQKKYLFKKVRDSKEYVLKTLNGKYLWRSGQLGNNPYQFDIKAKHNCLDEQDAPVTGVFSIKAGWNPSFQAVLTGQLTLKWRVKKAFLGFIMQATLSELGKTMVVELEMPCLIRYEGTIRINLEALLQHFPCFQGREEELATFIITMSLISQQEWEKCRKETRLF